MSIKGFCDKYIEKRKSPSDEDYRKYFSTKSWADLTIKPKRKTTSGGAKTSTAKGANSTDEPLDGDFCQYRFKSSELKGKYCSNPLKGKFWTDYGDYGLMRCDKCYFTDSKTKGRCNHSMSSKNSEFYEMFCAKEIAEGYEKCSKHKKT